MKKLLLTAVCALASCVAAKADTVGLYTFASSSLASSDTNADSTASAITAGTAFTGALTPNTTYGNPAPSLTVVSTLTTGTSQAAAITANQYFSFTLTPNAGTTLNLSTLSFDYGNYSTDTTFPTESFFARSSADSFGANLAAAVSTTTTAATVTNTTISLSGAAFQNLTAPIEFRIYIYDGTTNAARGAVLDNITVANVPEPTTYAMLIAGASFVTVLRCRRRARA